MIEYIKTLLPRLQQFSKDLNDTAIFADVPWGFIDDDGDRVTYIFRRNNELLVSKRGDVTTGHWEYLSVVQSLLIEHDSRKKMYNQGFVDNVVMILRKDGTDDFFTLANQQAIPDLNPVKYLEGRVQMKNVLNLKAPEKVKKPLNRVEVKLVNPSRYILIIPIYIGAIYKIGNQVYDRDTGSVLENGTFYTNKGYRIEVKSGKIIGTTDRHFNFLIIIILVIAIFFFFVLLKMERINID